MTELESTDLVCLARRQALSEHEQRRLEDLVQSSLDAKLMGLMLAGFERESQVQRGDSALIEHMAKRALLRARRRSVRRRPVSTWLFAAAVLLVGSVAGAWWVANPSLPPDGPSAATPQTPSAETRKRLGKARGPNRCPIEASESPSEPPPSTRSLLPSSADTTRAVRPTAGGAREAPPTAKAWLRSSSSASKPDAVSAALHEGAASAASLFAQANRLRREGHGDAAMQLYRVLLHNEPLSREAPLARLALAKLLTRTSPAQALDLYQVLAGGGGALRAEGLWGVVELAGSLGQASAEQQALSALLREYPDSAYADVARGRLRHGAR